MATSLLSKRRIKSKIIERHGTVMEFARAYNVRAQDVSAVLGGYGQHRTKAITAVARFMCVPERLVRNAQGDRL